MCHGLGVSWVDALLTRIIGAMGVYMDEDNTIRLDEMQHKST